MNYRVVAFLGTLFMVATGALLAFFQFTFSPWIWLAYALGSSLATAWWLFHIYFTLLVPIYRPVLKAMFINGKVPIDWVKEEFENLIRLIEQTDAHYVVLGCCSLQLYESLFRRAAASAKLNPFRLEIVNLREQCALPHANAPSLATEKARLLILGKGDVRALSVSCVLRHALLGLSSLMKPHC